MSRIGTIGHLGHSSSALTAVAALALAEKAAKAGDAAVFGEVGRVDVEAMKRKRDKDLEDQAHALRIDNIRYGGLSAADAANNKAIQRKQDAKQAQRKLQKKVDQLRQKAGYKDLTTVEARVVVHSMLVFGSRYRPWLEQRHVMLDNLTPLQFVKAYPETAEQRCGEILGQIVDTVGGVYVRKNN